MNVHDLWFSEIIALENFTKPLLCHAYVRKGCIYFQFAFPRCYFSDAPVQLFQQLKLNRKELELESQGAFRVWTL